MPPVETPLLLFQIECFDHVIVHVAHLGLLRLVAVPSHDRHVPCFVQWPMHLDPLAHQRVATKP
jgi:hypothetical protein